MEVYYSKICSCGEDIDKALLSAMKAVRFDEQVLTEAQKELVRNNLGGLVTEEDISGKLDADELPEAINAALLEAKVSGEFTGKDGAGIVLITIEEV